MGLEVPISEWEAYIPEYGGHRARYVAGLEPEPTTVMLRVPTWGEYEAAAEDRTVTPAERRARVLRTFVGAITSLRLSDGTEIPDGLTLAAHAERIDGAFLMELDRAIATAGRLSLGLKKKLPSPPGSTGSPPASGGTAASAGAPDST